MNTMSNTITETGASLSTLRSVSLRSLLVRGLVVAVVGTVLWVTVGRSALLITPAVALLWLITSAPIAFVLGQVLVLFELQRWFLREAIVVEMALGTILLVSLVERRDPLEPVLELTDRAKLVTVFGGTSVGLAAIGWFGSALTGNVAIGGSLLGLCSLALGYVAYRTMTDSGGDVTAS